MPQYTMQQSIWNSSSISWLSFVIRPCNAAPLKPALAALAHAIRFPQHYTDLWSIHVASDDSTHCALCTMILDSPLTLHNSTCILPASGLGTTLQGNPRCLHSTPLSLCTHLGLILHGLQPRKNAAEMIRNPSHAYEIHHKLNVDLGHCMTQPSNLKLETLFYDKGVTDLVCVPYLRPWSLVMHSTDIRV